MKKSKSHILISLNDKTHHFLIWPFFVIISSLDCSPYVTLLVKQPDRPSTSSLLLWMMEIKNPGHYSQSHSHGEKLRILHSYNPTVNKHAMVTTLNLCELEGNKKSHFARSSSMSHTHSCWLGHMEWLDFFQMFGCN